MISDYHIHDCSLGVVFEGFDRGGKFRAIMGGGRYDTLLETFGGEAVPAVGFGFGDAVIVEMLKSKQLLPDTTLHSASIVVYALTEELRGEACRSVQELRDKGLDVELILLQKKPKWVRVNFGFLNCYFELYRFTSPSIHCRILDVNNSMFYMYNLKYEGIQPS